MSKDEIIAALEQELDLCENNAIRGLERAVKELDDPARDCDADRLKASEFFFARAAASEERAEKMRRQLAELKAL